MDPKLKEQVISRAVHYWYLICIFILIVVSVFFWQRGENAKAEAAGLKAQMTIQESIKETEARLEAMKAREAEYLKIQISQEKLNATLIALDKKQNELRKLKKGNIENEIKKMDSATLGNTFNTMGLPVTIVK